MKNAFLIAITGLVLATSPASASPSWKARRAARDQVVRGLVELGRDDAVAAERAFAQAATHDPGSVDARYLLGLTRLALERPLEALADLEAATGLAPSPFRAALLARARGLRALDRIEEAETAETDAAEIPIVSVEDNLRLSWLFLGRGVEMLQGARGAAIAAISAHERKNPFLGRLTLSCVDRRLGLGDDALRQARFAARLPGAGAWAQVHLADLLREHGVRGEETRVLERAVLLDVENLGARERLAALAIARGDINGAHDTLSALCAAEGAPPGAFWSRAWVRLRFGQAEAAITDLSRALAALPDAGVPGGIDPLDPRLRPDAWRRIEDATKRIEAKDLEIVPDLYLRMRGGAYLEVGRYASALRDLERAVEVTPEQATALRPAILRARLGADPAAAGRVIEARLPDAIGDERLDLGGQAVASHLVAADWPGVLETASRLRAWVASRHRDRTAQGFEPGSRVRRDLVRRDHLCRLLEARALLAAGRGREALAVLPEGRTNYPAAVAATRAYLDEARRDEQLAVVAAVHDPTALMLRGRDHPLNGWAARFASEACRRAGDERSSREWFAAAVREALPTWSEEIVDPAR